MVKHRRLLLPILGAPGVAAHEVARRTGFSVREYQVLNLIASGFRAKEIAGRLFLSVKTVSTYRCRLLAKLNLNSNAELVRYALTEGVVD